MTLYKEWQARATRVASRSPRVSDLRQQFSKGSDVHAALFDAYVTGPAVTNVWKFRPAAPPRERSIQKQ